MKKEVNVIVINLLCRKSRRLRILKLIALLKKASEQTNFPIVSVSILEAVDGVNQSFRQLEKRYGLKPFPNWAVSDDHSCALPSSWRSNQTSGGIASGLSHLDVAAHAVGNINKKDQLTLVMEDDCVLTVPPETAYTYFASCVEDAQDWDIIMLGASGMRPDIAPACETDSSRFIEKAGFSYLTTMYWLSHEGAVKLVKNRKLCVENCLAFDELHNVLAGLTERVRSDVKQIFSSKTPIRLYSSKQSLVRQDPYDGVHDTVVIASCRENNEDDDDVESPPPQLGRRENFELEKLIPVPLTVPGRIEMEIFWLRRRFGGRNLDMEKIRQDLGLKNNMSSSALKRPRISSGGLLAVLAKMRNEKLQSHPFERTLVYEFLKSC